MEILTIWLELLLLTWILTSQLPLTQLKSSKTSSSNIHILNNFHLILVLRSDIQEAEEQIQMYEYFGSKRTEVIFKVMPSQDNPVFDFEKREFVEFDVSLM